MHQHLDLVQQSLLPLQSFQDFLGVCVCAHVCMCGKESLWVSFCVCQCDYIHTNTMRL